MTADPHENAKRLIATDHVEGIAGADREWLDAHLATCATCSEFASATELTIRSVRGVSVGVDPELVARTRRAVRLRAAELRGQQAQWLPLWVSCAVSWVLGGLSMPLVWRGIVWIEQYVNLPSPVWILLLMIWWALPTLAMAAILGSRRLQASDERLPFDRRR